MNLRVSRPSRKGALAVLAAFGFVVAASIGMVIRGNMTSGPALVVGADGSAYVTMGLVDAKEYRSAYFANVCVSDPGKITIRSIEPVRPRGGLEVTDFSVVSIEDDSAAFLGASSGRLRDEPSYRGVKTVAAPCSGLRDPLLFVEVFKPRSEDASAPEFVIEYDFDGDVRTAKLRFGFGLCEKDACGAL